LDERERSGLTVDVCRECRGVWLDRGELEKLLSLAKRELEAERAHYGAPTRSDYDREPPSSRRPERQGYQSSPQRPHYKKRSWLENLGEIFD
jgi:Zn-finger nucleic acid-binding protein